MLPSDKSIVITANPEAFRARNGDLDIMPEAYDGQLSNGGETLTLVDAGGQLLQQFAYDDRWYPETDGGGYSLQLRSPQTLPRRHGTARRGLDAKLGFRRIARRRRFA